MRESNFAFPVQNKACVCISSQLYDRRALDTTSALPLFNSLTHLTYLTSTSPRIREIMTMDGGLERLVRMLHEFCICPPPPDNPSIFYGLSPPNARPADMIPTLNPTSFDKGAAYRFTLAFQCVVNIGVRGSEPIRSRVVQAGTLEVVGCILEAWLANKGFAVGPSSSATGIPRETKEQKQARRLANAAATQQRTRDEAAELARALHRQRFVDVETEQRFIDLENAATLIEARQNNVRTAPTPLEDESNDPHTPAAIPSNNSSDNEFDNSTDVSTTATPVGSSTPTGTVVVPSRDRSGTIIARAVWDLPQAHPNRTHAPHTHTTTDASPTSTVRHRTLRTQNRERGSPSPPTDSSRPDTETEDDGDVDMDRGDSSLSLPRTDDEPSTSAEPSPERTSRHHHHGSLGRRAVGIVSDTPPTGRPDLQDMNTDAHIIINDAEAGVVGGDGGVGVEDGIVSLEANDDFAMGAPPGAPGAIIDERATRGMGMGAGGEPARRRTVDTAPDVTPRAGVVNLPMLGGGAATTRGGAGAQGLGMGGIVNRNGTLRARPVGVDTRLTTPAMVAEAQAQLLAITIPGRTSSHHHHHHRESEAGPYRDEDVLLGLQLLAYLSKYPHVRQAFYQPRTTFHPASANLPGARYGPGASSAASTSSASSSTTVKEKTVVKETQTHAFFKAFAAVSRGKEKEKATSSAFSSAAASSSSPAASSSTAATPSNTRQTNVFSLVERFTFRPSSTETEMPNPPPRLPPDIQYWAGVIMRNACRKDESRGGIRQCANMLCGRWESRPREFAKCRRCRKAKYCGKECQSTAWSEGHRFWCSAKDGDEEHATADPPQSALSSAAVSAGVEQGGTWNAGLRRERYTRERTLANAGLDAAETGRLGGTPSRPTGHAHGVYEALTRAAGPRTDVGPSRQRGVEREHTVVPPNRGRAGDPVVHRRDITTNQLGLDTHPTDHAPGRRRAETVTGAMAAATLGTGSAETLRHSHHPHQPPTQRLPPLADRLFDRTIPPARTDTPFAPGAPNVRSPGGGDHDMVLG